MRTPAHNVCIEADSEQEAREIFLTIDGCYFDPNYLIDCRCCGNRWEYGEEIENDYKLIKFLDESLKYRYNWSTHTQTIPFALIKYRSKTVTIQ